MTKNLSDQLKELSTELSIELIRILDFWATHTVDVINGGFYGKIDNNNQVTPNAPKGSVLNARILWSFSAGYSQTQNPVYLHMAHRAYEYITAHFIDPDFGGVYWTVDHQGNKLDTKKQVYASAFTLYGLSEYYRATGIEEVKTQAINLYHLLVDKSYDARKTGYLEAFTRDWQPINDLRLSAKDANEKKTMNTHLHVLEAYTNLYRIWPDEGVRTQIEVLIHNFTDHFIDAETNHLVLFFDEEWNRKSETVSYGHDIEASWLLLEAAEMIGNGYLSGLMKNMCIHMADATVQGLDTDGGLWYEYTPGTDHLIKEKHWWVQAEAVIGFYNAWQISGNEKYLQLSLNAWRFIKNKLLDINKGEWYWGITEQGNIMPGEDKAGLWKCPYHNSRMCIEILQRIDNFFRTN